MLKKKKYTKFGCFPVLCVEEVTLTLTKVGVVITEGKKREVMRRVLLMMMIIIFVFPVP